MTQRTCLGAVYGGKNNSAQMMIHGAWIVFIRKEQNTKAKESFFKGRFPHWMQTPAWTWQAPWRQTQDTAPNNDASKLQQQCLVTLFPRKEKQRGFEGGKPLLTMACQTRERRQPKCKHRSGLRFRVTHLTPTTEKRCSLIKPGGPMHTSEADISQSMHLPATQAEHLTLEE